MSGHTKLFGSTSSRTLGCPAHYQRGLLVPDPPSSDAALEGTMLHEFCEKVLKSDLPLNEFPAFRYLDFDQQNIVSMYVGLVREIAAEGGNLYVELRTTSPHLHPEWFGTLDAGIVRPPRLTIIDLKCGRIPVGVYEYGSETAPIPQLGSYAVSVLENLKPAVRALITEIELIIVQPREGGIKRAVFTRSQLDDLKTRLLQAAREAESDSPQAAIGPWCHFCKVKPVCPTQRDFVHEEAKLDFALDGGEPTDLELVDLHSVLAVADIAIEWGQAIKAHAERLLNDGDPLDGNWQLVPKRAKRVWDDERAVKQRLLSEGFTWEEISREVLLTPAQIEALAKKKNIRLDMTDLASSVSSGLKIAKVRKSDGDNYDNDYDAGWND